MIFGHRIMVIDNANFSPRTNHQVRLFNDRLWLIGGWDGDNHKNDIWSSVDGINWIEETPAAAFSERNDHQIEVFENKLWLMGGYGDSFNNDIWFSSDGINWIQETSPDKLNGRWGHELISFDNKLWLIGGMTENGRQNNVWRSEDGSSWRMPYKGILSFQ